ncbi:MAG: DUF6116 family protein [Thermoanaerobaculia bacterium]
MSTLARRILTTVLGRHGARLRFPHLLLALATLFLIDLVVPDLIPLIDEVLLGLATLAVGSLTRPEAAQSEKPPMKDVTPDERRHRDAPESHGHR